MLPQEKTARLSLAILGLVAITFAIAYFTLGIHRALGAFGFLGLLGFMPFVTLASRRNNQIVDERDLLILAKSIQVAYAIFWVVFVGGTMGLYEVYQGSGTVPVSILPILPIVGWIVITLVQSIATLVQYGRGH